MREEKHTSSYDKLKKSAPVVKFNDWVKSFRNQPPTIFRSTRLKLTGFYLAIIVVISLVLTISIRALAQSEFDNAGVAQRGIVNHLLYDFYSEPPNSQRDFTNFQTTQDANIRHELNDDVVLINLAVLIAGGVLSYWYAGRALKPIEDAHEAQTRFAADASHELRTPLANLKVENEVFLRQKGFSQREARELIESNLEEVQRLESLAGSLLSLTQYQRSSLSLLPIDISTITTEAVNQYDKLAEAKGMTITKTAPANLVLGQSDSIVELIGILLDNAIKYSPKDSTVYINGVKDGNHYHISVRDEGPGIDEADLPHIFERLYRGDKSRTGQAHGYGLGLSLALEIARANRASITARNYPSGGAQFVVSFSAIKAS